MKNLIPVNGQLLLEPMEKRTETESGIVLPSSAQERKNQGIILNMAEDIDADCPYQVGDEVIFSAHNEYRVKFHGKELILVHQNHILGVIYEDKN